MDIWFIIAVLKALFLSFFIVLIVREITTFISSFFGYVFKKKKKIKKGYFKDFWDNYKFMDFKKIFLGRFIKF